VPTESEDYVILSGEKVSPEALRERTEPAKKKRNLRWLRLMGRYPRWTLVLFIGVPGAILSASWKHLEQRFPKVNEFIHSSVSNQDDVDYQVYKLEQSENTYMKGIASCNDPKTSLADCRSAFLSSEPALTDMTDRISKLDSAWKHEVSVKSMPETCKQAGSREYVAFDEYVGVEKRIISLFKGVDPKSQTSLTVFSKELSNIVPTEDAALKKVHGLPQWPKECAGY
jgi:hypothetical protein